MLKENLVQFDMCILAPRYLKPYEMLNAEAMNNVKSARKDHLGCQIGKEIFCVDYEKINLKSGIEY